MPILEYVKRVCQSRLAIKTVKRGYVRVARKNPATTIAQCYLMRRSFMSCVLRALTKGYENIFHKTYRR